MKKALFITAVFSLFALVAYTMVNESIPVLEFDEISTHEGRFQISGEPDRSKADFMLDSKTFVFYLKNAQGKQVEIRTEKVKPGNFDQAQSITVIGRFHKDNYVLAETLLVKCPSKYEAQDAEDYKIHEY